MVVTEGLGDGIIRPRALWLFLGASLKSSRMNWLCTHKTRVRSSDAGRWLQRCISL